MNRYIGRRAIVTGGGSGIGQATVLRLLAEGGTVAAVDVSDAGLADTKSKAGDAADRLTTVVINVAD
jgi:NAD(P)-dependent dehydrogenase (short-subunit alcohol dehydrogenase family)